MLNCIILIVGNSIKSMTYDSIKLCNILFVAAFNVNKYYVTMYRRLDPPYLLTTAHKNIAWHTV